MPILHVVSWTGKMKFPCPRSRLRIESRGTGSRVTPLILHTQAESGFTRDSSHFPRRRPFIYTPNRHRVSPEFTPGHAIAYRWRSPPRIRRPSTSSPQDTAVPVPGAAFSGITMDQLMCAFLFPRVCVCVCV